MSSRLKPRGFSSEVQSLRARCVVVGGDLMTEVPGLPLGLGVEHGAETTRQPLRSAPSKQSKRIQK